jgi:hypothetical protein
MYLTILKTAQPFLQRFLIKRAAEYAAAYINRRREQRLKGDEEPDLAPVIEMEEYPPLQSSPSSGDAFWYTMSGILLGSAFGIILTYIIRREEVGKQYP